MTGEKAKLSHTKPLTVIDDRASQRTFYVYNDYIHIMTGFHIIVILWHIRRDSSVRSVVYTQFILFFFFVDVKRAAIICAARPLPVYVRVYCDVTTLWMRDNTKQQYICTAVYTRWQRDGKKRQTNTQSQRMLERERKENNQNILTRISCICELESKRLHRRFFISHVAIPFI